MEKVEVEQVGLEQAQILLLIAKKVPAILLRLAQVVQAGQAPWGPTGQIQYFHRLQPLVVAVAVVPVVTALRVVLEGADLKAAARQLEEQEILRAQARLKETMAETITLPIAAVAVGGVVGVSGQAILAVVAGLVELVGMERRRQFQELP